MKYWFINNMECKRSENNLTNVVKYVSYTRIAVELINGVEYTTQTSGTLSCPTPNLDNFISYNQLTKEVVEGWLDQYCGVVQIDEYLDAEINQMANPPLVILPLPFTN